MKEKKGELHSKQTAHPPEIQEPSSQNEGHFGGAPRQKGIFRYGESMLDLLIDPISLGLPKGNTHLAYRHKHVHRHESK